MIFHPDVKKSARLSESAHNLVQTFEKGVFDALEKKHLERLLLNIHSEDPTKNMDSHVLESYSFKFSYTDTGGEVNGQKVGRSKTEIQNATRSLLKKMVTLTSGLEVLPSKTWISVNLIYNKATPVDYEPPFFEPVSKASLPDFKIPPLSIDLGETNTGFDRVVIKLRIPDKNHDSTLNTQISRAARVKEPETERDDQIEDKFKNMNITNSSPKWTLDSLVADQENTDPGTKASRGKRKILCELTHGKKPKKSKRSSSYGRGRGGQIY